MVKSALPVCAALFMMFAGHWCPANAQALGKIVMYRTASTKGVVAGCPIRYKSHELVELGRGKYAEWSVPAGRYILSNKTASVEVAVDPGETRYVRCMIRMGALWPEPDFQITDEAEFLEKRKNYERKEISPP